MTSLTQPSKNFSSIQSLSGMWWLGWSVAERCPWHWMGKMFERIARALKVGAHYCSRNIWATYGLHMGHIWGPVLQHMELFQHMGKKILQKAQHMGNIWVSFSNIWGSFETYRSFLKHMGPFWNIWGLSWKVFVSFSDLPHCIIPVYEFFFFSKVLPITNQACSRYFCRRKTSVGGFRESLKPVFYHQSWNRKATAKISSWSCDCVSARSYAYYADDAPTVAWTLSGSLSSAAAAWRARACGSSKCPPPTKIGAGEPRRNLSFNFSWWVQDCLRCMHAASWRRSIDGDFDHEGDTVVSFSAG